MIGIIVSGGILTLIIQMYQTYYSEWQLADTSTGKQNRALKEFQHNTFS